MRREGVRVCEQGSGGGAILWHTNTQPSQATDSWSHKRGAHGEKKVGKSGSQSTLKKVLQQWRGPHRATKSMNEAKSVQVDEKGKNGLKKVWRGNTWFLWFWKEQKREKGGPSCRGGGERREKEDSQSVDGVG